MAARGTYGKPPLKDIMEKDIEVCVKKAKVRYSNHKYIYISVLGSTYDYYCADYTDTMLNPEQIIRIYENVNYSGMTKESRAKWILVK